MKRRVWHSTAAYVGLLGAAFVVAWLGSYRFFRSQLDNSAYDEMFRLYQPKPWQPQSAILAIDEATLAKIHGMRIRKPLADALRLVAAAHPSAVAIDVTLTDEGEEERSRRSGLAAGLLRHAAPGAFLLINGRAGSLGRSQPANSRAVPRPSATSTPSRTTTTRSPGPFRSRSMSDATGDGRWPWRPSG